MKRKWAYLALPLVLAALMFGVKWRAEHLTPITKENLEVRASLSKSAIMNVRYTSKRGGTREVFVSNTSQREMKPFVESIFLSARPKQKFIDNSFGFNTVIVECYFAKPEYGIAGSIVEIDVEKRVGRFRSFNPQVDGGTIEYFHPITAKRWLELLLAHPRIGPKLRARIK